MLGQELRWPASWDKKAEAYMALLIAQASQDPFSLNQFHLWFQWGFVFGSHELFSVLYPLPSALLWWVIRRS